VRFYKFSRPLAAASSFFALLSVIYSGSGCRRVRPSEEGAYLLADHLASEKIAHSPLLGRGSSIPPESAYPVESSALTDAGSNPLGLVRRHDLGSVVERILFAPAKSEYAFDVDLPENPVLDFGMAVVHDDNSEKTMSPKAQTSDGVEFIVLVEFNGRRKTLYQKHLLLPRERSSRTVSYARATVEIPRSRRKARLTLLTGGEEGAFSYWISPTLFGRRAAPTNVVLVSIDTLRADHLGFYGYSRDTTPHLDALARESAVFLNAYAAASWTLPSHVAMLTGLTSQKHKVYYEDDRMDPGTATLAELLRKRGYFCGAATGGGFVNARYGFDRGFESYGMSEGLLDSPTLAADKAREAIDWLDLNSGKPFFLFLHTYQVHPPFAPPDAYARRYLTPDQTLRRWDFVADLGGGAGFFRPLPETDRQNVIGLYDAEIRYTDDALIGPLVEKLKSLGVYDRTLLIVTSDHGTEFFEHGGWTHTWSLYNETLRVPLIVKFPGGAFAGQTSGLVVRLIDVVPTVLEALGIDIDPGRLDGRSLRPVLRGKERDDRAILAELAGGVIGYALPPRVAVSSGKEKLILNGAFSPKDLAVLITPPPNIPPVELYNLETDFAERTNLAGNSAKASLARQLAEMASAAMRTVKTREGRAIPKEIEDQLRALGYIK